MSNLFPFFNSPKGLRLNFSTFSARKKTFFEVNRIPFKFLRQNATFFGGIFFSKNDPPNLAFLMFLVRGKVFRAQRASFRYLSICILCHKHHPEDFNETFSVLSLKRGADLRSFLLNLETFESCIYLYKKFKQV